MMAGKTNHKEKNIEGQALTSSLKKVGITKHHKKKVLNSKIISRLTAPVHQGCLLIGVKQMVRLVEWKAF